MGISRAGPLPQAISEIRAFPVQGCWKPMQVREASCLSSAGDQASVGWSLPSSGGQASLTSISGMGGLSSSSRKPSIMGISGMGAFQSKQGQGASASLRFRHRRASEHHGHQGDRGSPTQARTKSIMSITAAAHDAGKAASLLERPCPNDAHDAPCPCFGLGSRNAAH